MFIKIGAQFIIQGLKAGLPRLPLGDLDAENKKKVDRLLSEIAL